MASEGFIQVVGTEQTIATLDRLETVVIRRMLTKATRAAGNVIVRATKFAAPKERGNLAETIGQSVRLNKTKGQVIARIGQVNKKRLQRKAVSLHLVEDPTQPHDIPFRKSDPTVTWRHPGTSGAKFFKNTGRFKRKAANDKFEETLKKDLLKWAARNRVV